MAHIASMKLRQQNQLTIPPKVVNALDVKPGDLIEFDVEDGKVFLIHKKASQDEFDWMTSEIAEEIEQIIENPQLSKPYANVDDYMKEKSLGSHYK